VVVVPGGLEISGGVVCLVVAVRKANANGSLEIDDVCDAIPGVGIELEVLAVGSRSEWPVFRHEPQKRRGSRPSVHPDHHRIL